MRHEFQQFEREETGRTLEERGIVHRKNKHPIILAKHKWREQERIFETTIKSVVYRGRAGGQ
jgi:hypothetical protein